MLLCFSVSSFHKASRRTCLRNSGVPRGELPPEQQSSARTLGSQGWVTQHRSMHPWHLVLRLTTFSKPTRKRQVFILTFSSRQDSNGANARGWWSVLISALGHLALCPLPAQPELIANLLSALSQALPAPSLLHANTACSLFSHLPFVRVEAEDLYFHVCI